MAWVEVESDQLGGWGHVLNILKREGALVISYCENARFSNFTV